MLRIADLEGLQNMLPRVSVLVDLLERRDASFSGKTKEWCSDLEKLLINNRISEAGTIAALRGVLISAERGVMPSEIQLRGQHTRQKARDATAAGVIRQAVQVLSDALRRDQSRIAEAERIVTQLVALAKAKALVGDIPPEGVRTGLVADLWRKMMGDSDLTAGTANVEGLVGPSDALVLLDRIIAKQFAAPG